MTLTTLILQPVEYSGNRLHEVGERIVTVFYPLLTDYKLNEGMSIADLGSILQYATRNSQKPYLRGQLLLDFLSNYEKPILGITTIPTVQENDLWCYGQGSSSRKTAYVSVSRREFNKVDWNTHIDRLTVEGLHELGHIFKLDHHLGPSATITSNKKRCPMDVSHGEEARNGTISWREYISSRDQNSFCKDCCHQRGILKR